MFRFLVILGLLFCLPLNTFAGTLILFPEYSRQTGGPDTKSTKIAFKDKVVDTVSLSGHYRYSKTGDLEGYNEADFRLGYDPKITDNWSGWLDVNTGFNEVQNIDQYNKMGAGFKYYAHKSENFKASMSWGLMYDFIAREEMQNSYTRHSFRPKAEYSKDFSSEETGTLSLNIDGVYYYQPEVDNEDNYDELAEVNIFLKVGAFSFGPRYEYENRSLIGGSEYFGFAFNLEY